MEARAARWSLGLWSVLVVLFLWIPLVIICLYAFNSSNIQGWPIAGLSTRWFHDAWRNPDARHSKWNFDTYVQAVIDALDAVERVSGSDRSVLSGICSGGILASITAAYLSATGRGDRLAGQVPLHVQGQVVGRGVAPAAVFFQALQRDPVQFGEVRRVALLRALRGGLRSRFLRGFFLGHG